MLKRPGDVFRQRSRAEHLARPARFGELRSGVHRGQGQSDKRDAVEHGISDHFGRGRNIERKIQHGGFGGRADDALGRERDKDGEDRVCGRMEFFGESDDLCLSDDHNGPGGQLLDGEVSIRHRGECRGQ